MKIDKLITPLRIASIIFVVLFIKYSIEVSNIEKAGSEPGLGGLAPLVAALFAFIFIIVDIILSNALRPKKNWIVQSVLIILFILFVYWKNQR